MSTCSTYLCIHWLTLLFKFLPEDMFIDFRERGKGGERERKKHQCVRKINQLLPVWDVMWDDPQPFWSKGQLSNQLSHVARAWAPRIVRHWLKTALLSLDVKSKLLTCIKRENDIEEYLFGGQGGVSYNSHNLQREKLVNWTMSCSSKAR